MDLTNLSLLLTDSYKVTHWRQLPPGTTRLYSYLESRGGMFPETVFVGLQPKLRLLKHFLKDAHVFYGAAIAEQHFGTEDVFNVQGWAQIKQLGYLPIKIKAVPEGTVVPTGNVLMTIENTDPRFPWLTNWLETILLQVWYPITVATLSREIKKLILKYLELTGDPSMIDFKLHDFGFRGSSSIESAAIGGMAHLVNFKGTDTLIALDYVAHNYGMQGPAGFSIPAAEHSTITSWGREHEVDAYRNMLVQFPTRLVAVVSDSWDIYQAVENLWGGALKQEVLARSGTVVIRPDSGYPPEVVTKVLVGLGKHFGYTTNPKGFKVLPPQVRVIQGDGVDYDMIRNVLHAMWEQQWSADNVAFGMGGALLQKVNRDTQKMAIKCSAVERDGTWFPVRKSPITDPGKESKAGRLKLQYDLDGTLITVPDDFPGGDELVTAFENGEITSHSTFDKVRERAHVA